MFVRRNRTIKKSFIHKEGRKTNDSAVPPTFGRRLPHFSDTYISYPCNGGVPAAPTLLLVQRRNSRGNFIVPASASVSSLAGHSLKSRTWDNYFPLSSLCAIYMVIIKAFG